MHPQACGCFPLTNVSFLLKVVCVRAKSFHFVTLWTVARWAPLSMGFSRQQSWSGYLFPTPGDLPDPGIKPGSLTSPALAGRFFITNGPWEARDGLGDVVFIRERCYWAVFGKKGRLQSAPPGAGRRGIARLSAMAPFL